MSSGPKIGTSKTSWSRTINFLTVLLPFYLLGWLYALCRADINRPVAIYRFASFWAGLGASALTVALLLGHLKLTSQLNPDGLSLWDAAIPGSTWFLLAFLLVILPYSFGYLISCHFRRTSWGGLWAAALVPIWLVLHIWLENPFGHSGITLTLQPEVGFGGRVSPDQTRLLLIGSALAFGLYLLLSARISRVYYLKELESGRLEHHVFSPAKRETLQRLAEALLPESSNHHISGRDLKLGHALSLYCNQMNLVNRIGLRLAVELLNWSPLYLRATPRRLEYLPAHRQARMLEIIESSPILPLRLLVQLLKLFFGQQFYEDQRALDSIGYVGESLGIYRDKLRWLNPPEHR